MWLAEGLALLCPSERYLERSNRGFVITVLSQPQETFESPQLYREDPSDNALRRDSSDRRAEDLLQRRVYSSRQYYPTVEDDARVLVLENRYHIFSQSSHHRLRTMVPNSLDRESVLSCYAHRRSRVSESLHPPEGLTYQTSSGMRAIGSALGSIRLLLAARVTVHLPVCQS